MKKILILGSTGSIGRNALEVVRAFPDEFEITALTANSSIGLLEKQIKEFRPEFAAVTDHENALLLESKIGSGCRIVSGPEGLTELTGSCDYDILLSSLVGFAGLAPTIEGVKRNKRIALANKETMVVAGELINSLCRSSGSEIIPVDSEHSAIFQCLKGENLSEVEKLHITASGGPFRESKAEDLAKVTVEEALNHPNWSMGNKITIDSATMMNKGLEVIEAKWLFGIPVEKIEVLIHPQSIIHSMVEFIDGSVKAQLSLPDMKLPIQYAFTYPERFASKFVETNLKKVGRLDFYEPDFEKFQCLKLAYDALKAEGTAPCVLNAANEIAVNKFLKKEIGFTKIPYIINFALDNIEYHKNPDIETIFECDRITRELVISNF